MRKRCLAFLMILLALAVCFYGCKTGTPEPEVEVVPEVQPLEPLPPIGTYNTATTLADSLFVGYFENEYSALFASAAPEAYKELNALPSLVGNADGTFVLTVIHDMITGETRVLKGTFTVSGDVASYTVADHGGTEAEADGETFTMTLLSENEMRLTGDQFDCVMAGDIFVRSEQPE